MSELNTNFSSHDFWDHQEHRGHPADHSTELQVRVLSSPVRSRASMRSEPCWLLFLLVASVQLELIWTVVWASVP